MDDQTTMFGPFTKVARHETKRSKAAQYSAPSSSFQKPTGMEERL
jgi:hypothetical protein